MMTEFDYQLNPRFRAGYGATVFSRFNFSKAPPERPSAPSPTPRPFDAAALERFRMGQEKLMKKRRGILSTMVTQGLDPIETSKNKLLGE